MAKFTTSSGPLTLAVHCDEALETQARSLLEALMSFRGQGKGLADGVTVHFGWSVLTLRQRGTELVACEPDYAGDPFAEVRENVSCTLAVLVGQAAVLNRLGLGGIDIRFDDRVLLAKGCLGERRVYLQRREPGPGDSGWYVGPVDSPGPGDDLDQLESVCVYELLGRRPELLQVLGLPPGYLVVFDGDKIDAVLDERNENVWPAEG